MSDATEIDLSPEPPAPKRSRGKAIGLGIGALAVVAGGAFAAFSLAAEDSNTPEQAVRDLLQAIDDGDVLGALEQLEPGERDAVRDPLVRIVDELNRLEVLEGASLDQLEGLDVGFADVELSVEEVADDIARVRVEGGTATYSVDPAELPLGDFVTQFLDTSELEASSDEEEIDPDEDDVVTTVKRDGTWYVSIGHSIAETARRDAGVAADELGEGIEADGAASPEAAVQELLTAAVQLDLRRALELLPPGEMGAVHRYADLWLADAEAALEDAPEFEIEMGVPEFEVRGDDSRRSVLVSIPSFRASAEGMSFEYEDGCVRVEGPGTPAQEICQGDDPLAPLQEQLGVFGMFPFPPFPELSIVTDPPDVGVTVVEVDGEWYVSPVGTMLDAFAETLGAMERADLDAIVGWFEEFETSMEESFSEGFATYGEGEDFEVHVEETTPTTTG